MSDINKKYPVNTAVWIATALLAAETFEKKSSCSKLDMYFDQPIIEQAKERISSGEDFESVAKEVSRFSQIEYQVSRGTLNPILEETAIYMSDGEVSDIIQTEQNYYLIRCVDDFDEVLSSENESQVFGKLRYATWSQSFTSYAKEHTVGISEEIWENLHFYQTTAFTSDDLYETYDRYLASVTN